MDFNLFTLRNRGSLSRSPTFPSRPSNSMISDVSSSISSVMS